MTPAASRWAPVEIARDLPEHLVLGLENKNYGRDYLVDLDWRLLALVKTGQI